MELEVTGQIQRLMSEDAELVLFRVAQQALNNVRRHSEAFRVRVQVTFYHDRVRMSIKDNGCGFNAPGQISDLVSFGKLGLVGMYERTRTLRGTLTIQSEPDQGTVVIVDVPTALTPTFQGKGPYRKLTLRPPLDPLFCHSFITTVSRCLLCPTSILFIYRGPRWQIEKVENMAIV